MEGRAFKADNEVLSDFIDYDVVVVLKDGRILEGILTPIPSTDDYQIGDIDFDRKDAALLIEWEGDN